MSSRVVRNLARNWVGTLSTPYFDTINMEQNPSVEFWCTLSFISYGFSKLSYCSQWQEDGEIELIFFGPAGTGDGLLTRAEADAALFFNNADPSGRVVLTGRSAPEELSSTEFSGPLYGVLFRFGYSSYE